jgi:hypothetical protein
VIAVPFFTHCTRRNHALRLPDLTALSLYIKGFNMRSFSHFALALLLLAGIVLVGMPHSAQAATGTTLSEGC